MHETLMIWIWVIESLYHEKLLLCEIPLFIYIMTAREVMIWHTKSTRFNEAKYEYENLLNLLCCHDFTHKDWMILTSN